MAASYYVSLKGGSVVLIANVTATPTIVVNDGAATAINSGTYRNLISGFGTSAGNEDTIPVWGPGFTNTPNFTMHATDGLRYALTAGGPGPFTLYKDDRLTQTAPRQYAWAESHWKFVTADGAYFIPFKEVIAMSNSEPLY